MGTRIVATLTLALATSVSCSTRQPSVALDAGSGSQSTTVLGHWVLSAPADSTGFPGASQVELVLAPGTFTLSVTYPNRAPVVLAGQAELADGRLLTLIPSAGSPAAASVGFSPGQPFTRVASASGSTLLLAPPSSELPLPSSVWFRFDAARVAGIAR